MRSLQQPVVRLLLMQYWSASRWKPVAYADDNIIMAESVPELQEALNSLHEYCQLWSLSVNITKTKIVIFSKGKVRKHPKFYLNQNEIEVAEEYVYLGVTFTYNGMFTRAIDKQINQARKTMFVVLERSRKLKLPFDIVCELYGSVLVSWCAKNRHILTAPEEL